MSTSINVHPSYTDDEKIGSVTADFTRRPATLDLRYFGSDYNGNHTTIFFIDRLSEDQLKDTIASLRVTADKIEAYVDDKTGGCV